MPPRTTKAYKVFRANLERSRAFLRIFDKVPDGGRKQGQPSKDERELLRGSLVFAVGALDAYLSDLILEIVPAYAPKSPSLTAALRGIAKSDPGLALRMAITPDGRDREEEFRTALDEWLADKSFQGPAKVANAIDYLGCDLTWPDFDTATRTSAAKELQRVTDERHAIVHSGQKPYVRRQLAEETLTLISDMAETIDTRICGLYP
jgi:hypothetical protein